MRKIFILFFLIKLLVSFPGKSFAQEDKFVFAVTDFYQAGSSWKAIRKLDLNTGKFGPIILNGYDGNQKIFISGTNEMWTSKPDPKYGNYLQLPFSSGVAAMAYDKKNNRLFFTPRNIDQLRWVDLETNKVFYITDKPFSPYGNNHYEDGKYITRMVITPDGNGYAISNNGKAFIRFTTGKKIKITQLGSLIDDPSNGNVSIFKKEDSWGGDIIVNDKGELYMVTAKNTFFKINIKTRVATYLGKISGLPEKFTSNGMVVNDKNQILLSSSNGDGSWGWGILDPEMLTSTSYKPAGGIWLSSDLANSNVLQIKNNTNAYQNVISTKIPKIEESVKIKVFPNPVNENKFTVQFSHIETGNYKMILSDVLGRQIMERSVVINSTEHTEIVQLSPLIARGVYLFKLTSQQKNKTIYSKKVIVQ